MTTTATVETLTAEVRVLMVGNRQITLSVARQLDRALRQTMEPMGRVRIVHGEEHLIGRDVDTGALAIATLTGTEVHEPFLYEGDYPEIKGVDVCGRATRSRWNNREQMREYQFLDGIFGERVDLMEENIRDACHASGHGSELCTPVPQILIDAAHAEIQIRREDLTQRRADRALPLIVLAGLK